MTVAGAIAFDAEAVGQIVAYVAPGVLARAGYRALLPGPATPPGETLIVAVSVSLPLVALTRASLPGEQDPGQVAYVAVLGLLALVVGYLAALARRSGPGRRALAAVGNPLQPAGTLYAQTLARMSPDASVVVELKDGRRIWGSPRNGPQCKEDGVDELYLTHPRAEDEDGDWLPVGDGLIVPLGEICTIALSEDPTAAQGTGGRLGRQKSAGRA